MAEIIQGSDEWHRQRLGKATASRIADIVAKTKSGWAASRKNYEAQLIAERLTGDPTESFTNAAMAHGKEYEPDARAAYEFYSGTQVAQISFVDHPSIDMSGASPDGLVNDDGLIEIKCPNTATHIDTLTSRKVPAKYQTQMQWQMACTGRKWCHFVSYDPRMPEEMRLFITKIDRDNKRIAELEREVSEFLASVSDKVAELQERYAA